ncbi:MAG: CDP-alcohol phosphatidyltransferase family protein, partial [Rickettsiales bacterium]
MYKKIPNILTYTRLVVIPVIAILMIFPSFSLVARTAAFLFFVASITDFLDGYIARKYNIQTRLGRILDPIADKVLVVTILVILVYQGRADILPSLA